MKTTVVNHATEQVHYIICEERSEENEGDKVVREVVLCNTPAGNGPGL
jgi:hypothetical protein